MPVRIVSPRSLFLFILLALPGCAGTPAQAPPPAEEESSEETWVAADATPAEVAAKLAARQEIDQVQLPLAVGGMLLSEKHVYDDGVNGTVYSYSGDVDFTASVFVYPLSEPARTMLLDAGDAMLVTAEFRQVLAEIEAAASAGIYEDVKIESARQFEWNYNFERNGDVLSVPFAVVGSQMALQRSGQALSYTLYLTEFNGQFVKIRVMNAPYEGLSDEVFAFARDLLVGLYNADAQTERLFVPGEAEQSSLVQYPGESAAEFIARARQERGTAASGDSSAN
ncbi:MAG: hypothetical protein R3217_07245 [Gammaproteobacteria bacterium]|nr:hypothetical protein [Gammaproteobacteria bacterium]